MYARAMQTLYALALEQITKVTGDHISFFFRKEKAPRCLRTDIQYTGKKVLTKSDIRMRYPLLYLLIVKCKSRRTHKYCKTNVCETKLFNKRIIPNLTDTIN